MSSIDDLKSTFTAGFARSNRYRVLFPNGGEVLSVVCDSVSWPGRQIFTNERFIDLNSRKVAYAFGQEDVNMTFLLGNDWYAWDYLNDWQSRTIGNIDELSNYVVEFKNTYTDDIEIQHLDQETNVKKKAILKNAYPTSLDALELGNANENEVIRVSASFSYDNWKIIS